MIRVNPQPGRSLSFIHLSVSPEVKSRASQVLRKTGLGGRQISMAPRVPSELQISMGVVGEDGMKLQIYIYMMIVR